MGVNSLYKTYWGKLAVSLGVVLSLLIFTQQVSFAQEAAASQGDTKAGQTLFQTNCASCHNPIKPMTGPALKGVTETVPGGMNWIYDWVHNSSKVIASGD